MQRILTRHGLHRLAWLDRPTGTVIRRYERDRPGELIHVDVKKLGRIPDGGGHKVLGRDAGRPIRGGMGFDYVHSAVDDHSRLAYSEIHPDEKVATCAGFLTRAAAFFHAHGITRVERVLTDNAWAYLRPYTGNEQRTAALEDFLHTYNYHRCHTALGGQPPISRVNNPAGQYT